MSTFKYGDDKIEAREIMIAIPSMAIAIGILTFPRHLSDVTEFSDGWVSIILSGVIAMLFAWAIAKLASKYPNQSFLSYASLLVSKPVAIVLTLLFSIQGIALTAFEVRAISDISHQYLFDKTPFEVVGLCFLLVVVYAVSGSRAGVFRLNTLFFPIIFCTTVILIFFAIGYMEVDNLLPVFKTDMSGYLEGTMQSALSYTGIGILFFYISLVKNPKKTPRMAAFGMGLVVITYVIIYLTCVAVYGPATEAIRFPLVELAKEIEVPGGFFERLESVFFVIWIMAIFTTTMMAFDVTVMALNSIFPKTNKMKIIFLLSPLIYFVSTIPSNYLELGIFAELVSYSGWGLSGTVIILLWIMHKIKGGRKNEK
ncbi:GerAB/ArcD/ProY family transporter [Oceanobacillus bengalensis]|uniref:Spore gernimation protein n=1 Tax=Oceanobacillus bengalensis TaxID=1435466 RepID=A0A494YUL8_9BACI|nr:endospore germination permease [Oceanobacillus bengalensis]RKQ13797.1 spore gernimation protein [Oceanobacillus bengalensis]